MKNMDPTLETTSKADYKFRRLGFDATSRPERFIQTRFCPFLDVQKVPKMSPNVIFSMNDTIKIFESFATLKCWQMVASCAPKNNPDAESDESQV